MYLHEKRLDEYNEITLRKNGVYIITAEQDLVNNLTVAENLEVVRKLRFLARIFSRKKVTCLVDEYLLKEEIKVQGDCLVEDLTPEDKQKLSILKSKMHGASLIVLDCTKGYYEGNLAEELCDLILKISKEGIAFIVLSERYSQFANIANRIQMMHLGKDLMEWNYYDDNIKSILLQNGNIKSNINNSEQNRKKFYGLYDYYWGMDKNIWDFLKSFQMYNPEYWKSFVNIKHISKPFYYDGETAIIPKESASLLIPNLSIQDNVIITIPRRVGRSKYGVIRKKLASYVTEDFYERTGIDREVKMISELSDVHKKILSLYRWEMAKPKTIILENPYLGMDMEDSEVLRKYLYGLSDKGIKIIYFSKSIEEMKQDCMIILATEDGKNAILYSGLE